MSTISKKKESDKSFFAKFFELIKTSWRIPEIKNKLLFTFLIIILFRLAAAIPTPYFNFAANFNDAWSTSILGFMNILSGGSLSQGTMLALGVGPYITASIVMQLLTIAIPPLERLSKEGPEGQKKINLYTRITTVILAIIEAVGYTFMVMDEKATYYVGSRETGSMIFAGAVMVCCYVAGAMIVMWFAEKINDHGIGNGVSIILFAGIVAGVWQQIMQLYCATFDTNYDKVIDFNYVGLIISICVILFVLAMIVMIVWMSDAERRIPIQYAKRVVGRKMFGGQSSNLPLKVNMSGVMPIIFANSIVMVPLTIASFLQNTKNGFAEFMQQLVSGEWGFLNTLSEKINLLVPSAILRSFLSIGQNSVWYFLVTLVLLVAFAYFYIAISFNPVEVANNIKNNGGAIPGIRSGKPTVDFIKKVLNRITLLGALLIAVIAGIPLLAGLICTIFAQAWNMPSNPSLFTQAYSCIGGFVAFSGSSLMIVVGVALETVRELEAQISLRSYNSKGFLN